MTSERLLTVSTTFELTFAKGLPDSRITELAKHCMHGWTPTMGLIICLDTISQKLFFVLFFVVVLFSFLDIMDCSLGTVSWSFSGKEIYPSDTIPIQT